MGLPLTPQRSIAIDPQFIPMGAPVFLATTQPNSEIPLQRLMLAQDTGGAIKNAVRADYFWGFGAEAGEKAGRMKQRGMMWVLLPKLTLRIVADTNTGRVAEPICVCREIICWLAFAPQGDACRDDCIFLRMRDVFLRRIVGQA